MKDRISTNPNRFKIAFEDSSLGNKWATLSLDDDPQEPGTPLNSTTLCNDSLLDSLGLPQNATPSEAMESLRDYNTLQIYKGQVINGVNDTIAGYGIIAIERMSSTIYKMHIECKITEGATGKGNVHWGINRDFIYNKFGILLQPLEGGYWNLNNLITDASLLGYGPCWASINQFWVPGRMYTLEGVVGAWPSNSFQKDLTISGDFYGEVTNS